MVRLHSEIDARQHIDSAEARQLLQLPGVKATDVTGKNKVTAFFKRLFSGTWFGGIKETVTDNAGKSKTYFINKKSLVKFLNNNTSDLYSKKTKPETLNKALSALTTSQSHYTVAGSISNKLTTLIQTGHEQNLSTAHLKTFLLNCGVHPLDVGDIIKKLIHRAEVAVEVTINKEFYDSTLSKLFSAADTTAIKPHYQTILKELQFASSATQLEDYFSGKSKKQPSDDSIKLALVGMGIIKEEDSSKPLSTLFPEYPEASHITPTLLYMSFRDKLDDSIDVKPHALYEKNFSLIRNSKIIKTLIKNFQEEKFTEKNFTDESIRMLLLGLGAIEVQDLEKDLGTLLGKTMPMSTFEKMESLIALVKEKGPTLKPLLPECETLLPALLQWEEIKAATSKAIKILKSESKEETTISDKEIVLILVGSGFLSTKHVNLSLDDVVKDLKLSEKFRTKTSFDKSTLLEILQAVEDATYSSTPPLQKEGYDLLAKLKEITST